MPVATFDTLKFANTPKAAGVPSQQAEAQAVAFAEVIQVNMKDLVTKDDLDRAVAALRKDLDRAVAATKDDLDRAVSDIRAELQTGLADVRREFKTELSDLFHKLDARFDLMEQRLNAKIDTHQARNDERHTQNRWMIGVVLFGFVVTMIRQFFFHGP